MVAILGQQLLVVEVGEGGRESRAGPPPAAKTVACSESSAAIRLKWTSEGAANSLEEAETCRAAGSEEGDAGAALQIVHTQVLSLSASAFFLCFVSVQPM